MNHHFRTWPPTEEEIELLVQIGTGESTNLEFKQEMPDGDAFRKEVCAFSNAHGGEIVIGIQEKNGIAIGILPQPVKNPDNEELKILETIRTATTPPIPGVKITVIPMGGGYVTAIRVPKSWIGPHMDRSKKVFIRESTQSRPMEHIELKNAFLGAEEQAQRLRHFRKQRCEAIFNRDTPVQMEIKRSIVTHVMPMDALAGGRRFTATMLKAAMKLSSPPLSRDTGYNTKVDADGAFQAFTKGTKLYHGMTYAHVAHSGIVETVNCQTMEGAREKGKIPHSMVDQEIINAVKQSVGILDRLEVEPPFIIFLSLLDMETSYSDVLDEPEPGRRSYLFAHEFALDHIPETFEATAQAIRPALDNLANGFGLAVSPSFATNGTWQYFNGR